MIRKGHPKLSVLRQCKLLQIHRSGLYYKPRGESALNLELMRLMDEHYLEHPYKGARRMHIWLTEDKGYKVSANGIERLYYKVMGLRSVMPGRHTTKRNKEHKVYPYLLRNLKIERPNQVWSTDVTYIPMANGFMYLTAIIDVYSRYIVGWSLSNSMDAEWCTATLKEAVRQHGEPEIVNTDQGSQYTSDSFSGYVTDKENRMRLSMDSKGRATDNAYIESLWKSVKYEKVYLSPPEDGIDLFEMLKEYFTNYNESRRHSGIDHKRPRDMYRQKPGEAA